MYSLITTKSLLQNSANSRHLWSRVSAKKVTPENHISAISAGWCALPVIQPSTGNRVNNERPPTLAFAAGHISGGV